MNKKTIFITIIIVLVLAVAGFFVYYFAQKNSQNSGFPYAVDWSLANGKNIPESQLQRLKDDYERAKTAYMADPKDFSALMNFAFIYYQLGDYQSARDIYIKAGEISAKNYSSFWNLGNVCMQLKDYTCAENAYSKAVENGPDQSRHYLALSELYSNFFPDKKNQIPDLYKKGLETLPGDYDLLIGLAEYYKSVGDKSNAIKYYQEVIKKYPDSKAQIEKDINNL